MFKPEQKLSRLVPPRHEIAAYIIAGLLGIKNVPRDSFQSFKAKDFFALANKDYKMKNFMDQRGKELDVIQGNLQGSIQVFVPNLVYPKIDGLGLDKKPGIKKWMPYLKAKSKIPVDKVYLIQQMSNMIIFDFVIGNQDRWSGGNLVAKRNGNQLDLVFIDHAMSFGTTKEGHGIAKDTFLELQYFSRSLLGKLKSLTQTQLDTALEKYRGSYEFLVDKRRREALLSRAAYVVRRVEQMKDKRLF